MKDLWVHLRRKRVTCRRSPYYFPNMTSHEWHERDPETREMRYYRASKFNKRWTVMTTLKTDEEWVTYDPVPLEILEELRTLLLKKYQRRRIPYEDVLTIDVMCEAAGGPPAAGRT